MREVVERPDDARIAESYWQEFKPVTTEEFRRLEVVADSVLFFPDWQAFSALDESFNRLARVKAVLG